MSANWEQLWDLFHAALDVPDDQRRAFVEAQAADDSALRDEVLELLSAHSEDAQATLMRRGFDAIENLDAASLVGETIGPYKLTSVLGEGGMGIVYLAEQPRLERQVALKLIRLGMDTRQVVARFESERQALAKMNHPNVAQVIDAGATDSGRPFFVMEYIDGLPITEFCDKQCLNTEERLRLFLDVCAGVQHAHQKGIVHRDLKPTNVLVAQEDGKPTPKIIDFGIAKATAQRATEETLFTQIGMLIGTPEYMSPEQAGLSERDIDTRTDVYSLGVLLFELLVGALPFDAKELRRAGYDEIRRRIMQDEPTRPSARLTTLNANVEDLAAKRRTDARSLVRLLRGDLDWITMRAMEKMPDRRYSSPSELAADVLRHMRHEPVTAGPPSAAYRVEKFVRRHTFGVGAATAILLSLLIGFATATYAFLQAREAKALAQAEARTSEEVADFLAGLFNMSAPSEREVNSVTAREVLDRGVEKIRDELDNEPEVQSRLMAEMGKVYAQLGLLEDAETLFEQALEIRRSLETTTPRQLSETLSGLAGVKNLAGRHEEALAIYDEAIVYAEQEDDARWLAILYRSIGGIHDTLANNAESLAALQTARDRLETAGYSNDPEMARVLRNTGMAYWSTQDFDAARRAYEEALKVYDRSLDPGHPEVSYVVNSLAILNYNLGDFEAARPMFERELANLEHTLGREHRNTASVMNNLGFLLIEMGLYDEARPKIEESLKIRMNVLGEEHEEVATSFCNLGRLQEAENNHEAAFHSFGRCIEIRENVLGNDHPYIAGALERKASLARHLGLEDDAAKMEQRAAAIRENSN